MADGKITVTFKGMTHQNQPWVVVSGDDPLELANLATALGFNLSATLQACGSTGVVSGATEQAVQNLTAGGLNPSVAPENQATPQVAQDVQQPPNPQPQPVQQPPAQTPWGGGQSAATFQAPQCQHGGRTHRSGVDKNGKPWAAWFCPAQKGDPTQCDPIWNRDQGYVAPQ